LGLWQVPVHSQNSIKLCWEACGKMLWDWRFKNLAGYNAKAGNFLNVTTGLQGAQMDVFYTQLGLRGLAAPKGKNLRHALSWTPVIFTNVDKATGHAMVLAGFNQLTRKYTVVNPCLHETLDFDSGSDGCNAGTIERTVNEVEGSLGNRMWYW
jgi:hypothetical protein